MANRNNTIILRIGKILPPTFAVSTAPRELLDVILQAGALPHADDLCDIHGQDGKKLWFAILYSDVARAIQMFRDEGDQHWMNELTVVPWERDAKPKKAAPKPLGASDGLPIKPRNGVRPLLKYLGGDLQPGSRHEYISVSRGAWSASITIELALLHLDDFIDGHRARLVELLGHYFGVTLERAA